MVGKVKKCKLSHDGSKVVTNEHFNMASHMVAAIFSLIGLSLLVVQSIFQKDIWKIVGFSIYGFTLFFLFLASTLHHGIKSSKKVMDVLRKLDYGAVYLLIAGTITPFCFIILKDYVGWIIFGVVWLVSIVGIVLKSSINTSKWFNNTLYLALGWIGFVVAFFIFNKISIYGIILLILGGIIYTIGSFIYYFEKPNLIPNKFCFHELWHVFVIIGAFLHWLLMYVIVLNF
jgi:hemolysin III